MGLNRKGFTLIELLAVIAILAILIVLAVPNILNIFNDSKDRALKTQAQSIYKAAEQRYMQNSLNGKSILKYCNSGTDAGSNKLDLEGAGVAYYVEFNNTGKIVKVQVKESSDASARGVQVGNGTDAVDINSINDATVATNITLSSCN